MAHYLDPKNDLWLRFLTEINEATEEVPAELLEEEYIREAVGYMERSAYTKEELDRYYQWKVNAWSAAAMLENARAEGKEEGEAIGLEKGKVEGKAEVVLNAHKAGYSIETISTFTGLSVEKIKEILKQNS